MAIRKKLVHAEGPGYPRTLAADVQEAMNELEYWKTKEQALGYAIKQMFRDKSDAKKQVGVWEERLKKRQEKHKANPLGFA
jgi:hypothetical protein